MVKPDTGATTPLTTQSEASRRAEKTIAAPPNLVVTGPYPEPAEAEGDRYAFRVAGGPALRTVAVTIDAKQLEERARVRETNRAIKQSQR